VLACVLAVSGGLTLEARSSHAGSGVKLEVRANRPVVDGVFVNGHGPFRFLVDTGATLNHIDPAIGLSIGLTATSHTTLVTSTGAILAAAGEAREVRLGGIAAERQMFVFAGMDAVHQVSRDLQGVLGQAFLSQFDYHLNLEDRRLEFGEEGLDRDGIRADLLTARGRPVITTSLGRFVLDSGAHGVIRFGVRSGNVSQELVTVSGILKVGTVASRIEINGYTVWHGDAVVIPNSPEGDADGLLPVQLFKSVYVSNSKRYVVLR
jgi:hypothetical protein